MSQLTITDYFQWVPAVAVHKRKGILTLAAFEVDDVVWKGASEIYRQVNYSAGTPFYLTDIPDLETGSNVGLCIRYRVGETVTRYKLNNPAGFVLNDEAAPMYAGQVILGNFVIECWNLEDETDMILVDDLVLESSIRTVPSDLRDLSDVELAEGTVVSYAELQGDATTNPQLPDDISSVYDWNADDLLAGAVSSWVDNRASLDLTQGNAAQQPLATVAGINGHNYVTFDGVQDNLSTGAGNGSNVFQMYLVMRQKAWNNNRSIIGFGAGSDDLTLKQSGSTPQLIVNGNGTLTAVDDDLALNTWAIVRVTLDQNGVFTLQVNDGDEVTATDAFAALLTNIVLGSNIANVNFDLARIIIYQEVEQLTYAQDSNVKRYLEYQYGLSGGPIEDLPTTYNDASAWLTN